MPPKTCLVTVTDVRGIRHTAEVTAESVYEAAVQGLAALQKDAWSGQIGPATRVEVRVSEPVIMHTLSVQQLQRWLDGATTSPNEGVKKQRLRELLSAKK